jgi:serine protease AprX
MTETIRVRLVPKNRAGGPPQTLSLSTAPRPLAEDLVPDPVRAREALGISSNLGLRPSLSLLNKLDSLVEPSEFERIFSTRLIERTPNGNAASRGSYSTGESPKILLPEGELKVPTALAEQVAFAYVPTPPRFYAIQFLPPTASFHHLRLEDVARSIGAYRCHRNGWTGRGIRVAMADTGFFPHPFFDDYGFDIQRVHTPLTSDPGSDISGHGTGESANLLVVGPDCSLVGVKHDDYSAQALETSLAQNPRVVTNSWGWNIDNQSMSALESSDPNLFNEVRDISGIVGDAVQSGVTMIFSAGNGQLAFPASLPDVIAVGGTTVDVDRSLRASSFSSSFASQLFPGRRVPDLCGAVGESGSSRGHLMLPVPNGAALEGENLPQTSRGRGWGVFSGTSAAAPQVAGVVALMLSVEPRLTPTEIKSILMATARDVETGSTAQGDQAGPGPDLATGAGYVDAFAACLRVRQLHRT